MHGRQGHAAEGGSGVAAEGAVYNIDGGVCDFQQTVSMDSQIAGARGLVAAARKQLGARLTARSPYVQRGHAVWVCAR
jgi:hypothetical protein